jgi:hypothetical protein
MSVEVIYQTRGAFVTDLGAPVLLQSGDGRDTTIPRYAVWTETRRGKWEVAAVCETETDAIARADATTLR